MRYRAHPAALLLSAYRSADSLSLARVWASVREKACLSFARGWVCFESVCDRWAGEDGD